MYDVPLHHPAQLYSIVFSLLPISWQLFAMPETLIGLHPDVGASHFLARLPGHMGEWGAQRASHVSAGVT